MKACRWFAICLIFALNAAVASGELFTLSGLSGECMVQLPGSRENVPAEENRSYPPGTLLSTGPGASVQLNFADGSQARLAAATRIATGNGAEPSVRVLSGSVNLQIEPGSRIKLAIPSAEISSAGANLTVTVSIEGDMQIAALAVRDGSITVTGQYFTMKAFEKGDAVTLANAADMSFIRGRIVRGEIAVDHIDSDGNPQSALMNEGSTVKIWRRRPTTGQTIAITIMFSDPEGETTLTITYTERIERPQETGLETVQPKEDSPPETSQERSWWQRTPQTGDRSDDDDDGPQLQDWEKFPPVIRMQTVITTTTVPPTPTPVGRR